MSKGIFITGTGTDLGKTYISGLILKKLRDAGLEAGYYKPVLSGAIEQGNELIPGDVQHVCSVAGIPGKINQFVSFIYKAAVSPHLAARLEGNPPELNTIIQDYRVLLQKYDYLTVEGCGGIICPLRYDEKHLMLCDVIKALKLDVLVVAPSGLGSINSTVLVIEYAKSQGIAVRGIIMNCFENENPMCLDNRLMIEALTKVHVIATVAKGDANLNVELNLLKSCYTRLA